MWAQPCEQLFAFSFAIGRSPDFVRYLWTEVFADVVH